MVLQRLRNQHLLEPRFTTPGDEVRWLVAVQAQDYGAAKWALGLRLNGAVDADIERAFDEGTILRTHVLRPTWHFVAPGDIRWLLQLTAPRVNGKSGTVYRAMGLDDKTFARSRRIIEKALRRGEARTREELGTALAIAGIEARNGIRLACLMMRAELDGAICSGPRRGRQFTYMLLEARVPPAPSRTREEALGELARRYFAGHGPATVRDLAKWSGLTVADARRGAESVRTAVAHEIWKGQTYWGISPARGIRLQKPVAHLLSIYDEYLIGYHHASPVCDAPCAKRLKQLGNALTYTVLVDGRIVGTWRRSSGRQEVEIQTKMFRRLTPAERRALAAVAERYGTFTGLRAVIRQQGVA